MPMPIEILPTEIPAVKVVKVSRFDDDRGFFSETYALDVWHAAGMTQTFVQDNLSNSRRGAVRGLHYQLEPRTMGKLIRCMRGAIYDVAVDLRRGSPTFGKYVARELSADNGLALWVPSGFAHGFMALDDDALIHYKCDGQHAPTHERSLSYRCPKIAIAWPAEAALVSAKDLAAPGLDEAEYNFTYDENT